MKNFYLCIIILALFSACSNDGSSSTADTDTTNASHREMPAEFPANANNDYDLAGQIHNEILAAYYEATTQPNTLDAIIGAVEVKAAANPNFASIRSPFYHPPSGDRIAHITNLKANAVDAVVDDSGLSATAKGSFRTFISSLLHLVVQQENYRPIYDFIISYEALVKASPAFTAKDKELILTTTSIARHSVYLKKKRPKKNTDPDWDWMTGNIVAGTDGAEAGTAEAITMAVAVGVYENRD